MNSITTTERAVLERQRLARQKRRTEEASVAAETGTSKKIKTIHRQASIIRLEDDVIEISDDEDDYISTSTRTQIAPNSSTAQSTAHQITHETKSPGADEERFWHGISLSVRNQLVHNPDKTLSLKEIVGKEDLDLVIAASFCWEMDWFAQHFPDPREVPTVILTQPTNESNGRVRQADDHSEGFKPGSVVSFAFLPGGYGCQHMKFLLLFYKSGRLRVVITSANMRSADWYVMDNTVFVQDLHRSDNPAEDISKGHAWPMQLHRLMKHCRIDQALRHLQKRETNLIKYTDSFLHNWDWSKVKALLVMSLPGSHVGSADALGMLGIAQQVRAAGWIPDRGEVAVAEYQSSSLCRLTAKWAHHMQACFNGKSVEEMSKMKIASKLLSGMAGVPLKVIYPSIMTVDASVLGRDGGGSMFCTGSHFTTETKPFFADAVCKYGALLMHTKMIICLFRPATSLPREAGPSRSSSVGGWAYVAGSHNLSQAAWGHLSFTEGQPKIYIKNYELGVILPIPRENGEIIASRIATWKRPPRAYTSTDVPFMQTLHMAT